MNRPLVIAHRGNSHAAPENTLMAIREAIELGTDCVEVDVRCTRDGVPILYHDPAIGRLTGNRGNISELSLEDVRRVDVRTHGESHGEPIPTLEEALLEAAGKTRVLAEVKVDCAGQIRQVVDKLGIEQGVFFSAFRLDIVQKVFRVMPQFDVSWVLTTREWAGQNAAQTIETASESEIHILSPPVDSLTQPSVSCAHEMGISIWTYECEEAEDFRKAMETGADGIITSNPQQLMRMLREMPAARIR